MTITYIKATAATLANNSKTITVTGEHVDFSKANDYLVALDNGLYVLPVASGTAPDANGDSTLTLVETWGGATLSNKGLFIFPTFAKIYESVQAMTSLNDVTRGILTKLKDLLTATTPTLDIAVGQTTSIETVPYGYLTNQVTALISQLNGLMGSVQARTKSEFFTLAAQNVLSGFAEWGKSQNHNPIASVNEGMWAAYTSPNTIRMGRSFEDKSGVSVSDYPIVTANGVEHHINLVGQGCDPIYNNIVINFPPAPDGLDKSDGTGRFVDLAAAIVAGGTSLSASILSRKDFAFIEPFHEKISDKDVVYPLGNVQYGKSTWKGVALSNTRVDQRYSALGEWDAVTRGYGVTWSTLTDEQKALFVQDHKNKIYSDDGELVQARYRIRVVAGLGDSWQSVGLEATNTPVRYSPSKRVKPQGKQVSILGGDLSDYGYLAGERHYGWFVGKGSSERKYTSEKQGSVLGLYSALSTNRAGTSLGALNGDDFYGHNGECHLIPIALVQRRNQGGYHKHLNKFGTKPYRFSSVNPSFTGGWHVAGVNMQSTSDCFDLKNQIDASAGDFGPSDYGGNVGTSSGRKDGKFYDAIDSSDVFDLRMSSRKKPVEELYYNYKRKAISGELRGFEGVPFTRFYITSLDDSGTGSKISIAGSGIASKYTPNTTVYLLRGNVIEPYTASDSVSGDDAFYLTVNVTAREEITGVVLTEKQIHQQANPTWTNIIGEISHIVALFTTSDSKFYGAEGLEGEWIPVISDGTYHSFPYSRKVLSATVDNTWSDDDGVTFSTGGSTVDKSNHVYSNFTANRVRFSFYETQAHFTQNTTGITQLTNWSPVYATNNNADAILTSSLSSKIATGTDPSEELAITKIASDVISHTPETLTPVVKYSTAIGVKDSVAYLLFNCDDAGVIDGSNIRATALPYFINEL